jgi:hypothetical protein
MKKHFMYSMYELAFISKVGRCMTKHTTMAERARTWAQQDPKFECQVLLKIGSICGGTEFV